MKTHRWRDLRGHDLSAEELARIDEDVKAEIVLLEHTEAVMQDTPRIAFRPQHLIVPSNIFRGNKDRLLKKRFARLVHEARKEKRQKLDRHDRWSLAVSGAQA